MHFDYEELYKDALLKIRELEKDKAKILKEKEYAFQLLKKHGILHKAQEFVILETLDKDDCEDFCKINMKNKTTHALAREHKEATGAIRYGFIVNRPPRTHNEYHFVTNKAEIIVFGDNDKYITTMFARPGNLNRYNIKDNDIINEALKNLRTGKNAI